MGLTIGIDLGTTNSAACIKKLHVSSIPNLEGETLTPSCVTAVLNTKTDQFDYIVGRAARDLIKQYPEQTITSVKRLMGRDFEESSVQDMINQQLVSYQITTDPDELHSIKIPLGGRLQTPEMISSYILKKIISDGEKALQGNITQAVVTVPAYFSDKQKFATRAACEYAGIKLLRLLPEPTAAALSFSLSELDKTDSKTVLVFDLGGGTFDLSVLNVASGHFMEVTKGGDMWLGGDNIDQLLIKHIYSKIEASQKCQPITELIATLEAKEKASFLAEIKEKAERCKVELSTEMSTNIEMFGILKDKNQQLIDIDITITRDEFNQLIKPVVDRMADIAMQILHEIRFEPDLIDIVLMVGGTSLIPAIQDKVRALFGNEKVHIHPRPMLAVAEGAALMAAKMISHETDESTFQMMHSTAHDYYLQLANGKKHLLVARNTPLPVSVEEKLYFTHKAQHLARLRIFNEAEGILETVGELWFHREEQVSNSKHTSKKPGLMLRFSVDEDNIITMKAWSLENSAHCIEAQIARGGVAAKLYNDLESTLSSIVAQCEHISMEEDSFLLSRKIVSNILSISDPMTGETCMDKKRNVEKQITTLKGLQRHQITPKGLYEFALVTQEVAESLLTDDEHKQLNEMVIKLNSLINELNDIDAFVALKSSLHDFYDDRPTVPLLTQAHLASKDIKSSHPEEARIITNLAQQVVNAHKESDEEKRENAADDLSYYLNSHFTFSDKQASRRFDRDVNL